MVARERVIGTLHSTTRATNPRLNPMRHFPRIAAAATAITLLTACTDAPTTTSPRDVPTPLAAKGGNIDTDSRADWYWATTMSDGITPTAIRGDGRRIDGSPVVAEADSSEYPGEQCGVRGKIFWSYDGGTQGSGDAVFDPSFTTSTNPCGKRTLRVDLGSGFIAFTPFTNARDAAQLAPGASSVQVMVFSNHEYRPCERFIFEPDSGSGVRLTRLHGDQFGNGNGEWTVESAGDHKAGCYNWSKGTYQQTGGRISLPFRARFVEKKYPF